MKKFLVIVVAILAGIVFMTPAFAQMAVPGKTVPAKKASPNGGIHKTAPEKNSEKDKNEEDKKPPIVGTKPAAL
ncbi:MAG: hypothetical protein NTX75_00340 [Proteobacteria bacterium]|nr:hypothetical protein [Pseudomonadota bacterium]